MARTTKRRLGLAGLVVTALSIGVLIASRWFFASLTYADPFRGCTIGSRRIDSAHIALNNALLDLAVPYNLLKIEGSWSFSTWAIADQQFYDFLWWPEFFRMPNGFYLDIPLWIPTLLLAIPSFILWRQNRKQEGHCNCGYDLTGNVSGVCPECGTKLQANGGGSVVIGKDSAK